MPEELDPTSMSDDEIRREATTEAWEKTRDWQGRDVVDVHGTRVGQLTRCFISEGEITHCEVRVDKNLKRTFNVIEDVTRVRPEWFARVRENVELNKAAKQVVTRENAKGTRWGHGDRGGSDAFPRKTR